MTNDLITLIANLALTLSFVVALIFGIAQVKAASRDRRERLTLEALRNFQTHKFAEFMLYITSTKMPLTRKEMLALPQNEQVFIIQFAQEMESLGILVAEKFINIDLVDKTLGSLLIKLPGKNIKQCFLIFVRKRRILFLVNIFNGWLNKLMNV